MKYTLLLLIFQFHLLAQDFNLIKLNKSPTKPTLLVIGGIHGNEPGGYFSAAILAQHYKVQKGNLWVVPDLNRKSIQQNKRGINGDMNRKFSNLQEKDQDSKIVDDIKKVILSPEIDIVLNLHDGHGFYRENYESTIFNPNAWGQTFVIDQSIMESNPTFCELNKIASKVKKKLNTKLFKKHHIFDVRNTQTKFHDESMQHSLTYFAVTHNKPAFAIETSKNLETLSQKVFYQLNAIEEFMNIMEIEFTKDFNLTLEGVSELLKQNGEIVINNKILLNLRDIRKYLSYIPLKSNKNEFEFSHVLGSVHQNSKVIELFIGNKKISTLYKENFIYSDCQESVKFITDKKENVNFATEISVSDDFTVIKQANIRVNVIGFTNKHYKDESGVGIFYKNMSKKFSIDKNSKIFRVEIYKNDKFCGTINVNFKLGK